MSTTPDPTDESRGWLDRQLSAAKREGEVYEAMKRGDFPTPDPNVSETVQERSTVYDFLVAVEQSGRPRVTVPVTPAEAREILALRALPVQEGERERLAKELEDASKRYATAFWAREKRIAQGLDVTLLERAAAALRALPVQQEPCPGGTKCDCDGWGAVPGERAVQEGERERLRAALVEISCTDGCTLEHMRNIARAALRTDPPEERKEPEVERKPFYPPCANCGGPRHTHFGRAEYCTNDSFEACAGPTYCAALVEPQDTIGNYCEGRD